MSAAKHTPGPWSEARRSHCTVLNALFINGGGDRVARVVVPHTASNIEEYEANARLIAAAPDLLDALIRLRHWAEAGQVNYTGDHPVALARTAIAKATGGQP